MVKGILKKERPLTVDIPRPADEQPAWSRVGIIALIGFAVGIAWPKIAGVRIGPSVPGEGRAEAEAAPSAAPVAPPPETAAPAAPPPAPEANRKNEQLVVIGAGAIARCSDKKNKAIDECGALQFDPVAVPKLKELAQCPAALGLEGKLAIGFEINFEKKEVQVVKPKKAKTSLPSSTVNGILQCAAREFSSVSLDEVPHKYAKYSLVYTATFYPPGKHPVEPGEAGEGGDKPGAEGEGEESAGTTTSESSASGSATIGWDTALVRGEPKTGDVVLRLVRGTRVKIVGRQNDWYKIEHRGKTGWVYRGAIGL